jgi:AcrR family transcriptional regulator
LFYFVIGVILSQLNSQDVKKSADDTATRILDAAEVLFAENGFSGTSARDITSSAGCNVASINYYFNGKDNLYKQVCKRRLNALRDFRINSINDFMTQDPKAISLEGLLYNFSRAFLAPLIDEATGSNVMKLMVREMLFPQLPANMVFEELILPMSTVLQRSMLKVCPGLGEQQALWSIFSLVGQLLHTMHIQGMLANHPDEKLSSGFEVSCAVDHIVAFTVAGVNGQIKNIGERNNE